MLIAFKLSLIHICEAPVEDLGVVNVTMSGEQQTLNEVVVVGSGVQKKVLSLIHISIRNPFGSREASPGNLFHIGSHIQCYLTHLVAATTRKFKQDRGCLLYTSRCV